MAITLRSKKEIAADIERDRLRVGLMLPPKRKPAKKSFSQSAPVRAMRQAGRVIRNTAVSLKNSAVAAKNGAVAAKNQVVAAKNKVVAARENVAEKIRSTHRSIKRNPYPAIGAGLVAGGVVAAIAMRRRRKARQASPDSI